MGLIFSIFRHYLCIVYSIKFVNSSYFFVEILEFFVNVNKMRADIRTDAKPHKLTKMTMPSKKNGRRHNTQEEQEMRMKAEIRDKDKSQNKNVCLIGL